MNRRFMTKPFDMTADFGDAVNIAGVVFGFDN